MEETNTLITLPLTAVSISPRNPRLTLEPEAFSELKKSIEKNGLVQPIAVRVAGDTYEIVGGHRRFHALKELAHEHPMDTRFANVPALVVDAPDERIAAMRLAENINRAELSPHEIAEGIADAVESGMSEEELAASLGWRKRNVYRYTQFHASPAWLKAFAIEVPYAVKKTDANGEVVRDAVTDSEVCDVKKLKGLPFNHVFELITFHNFLREVDAMKFEEGGAGFRPQAERTIRKLAAIAAKEEWSKAKLCTEIKRMKDPPAKKTRASGETSPRAGFNITKKRVDIDLAHAFDDAQRTILAEQLTTALLALGFTTVLIDSAP